MNEDEERLSSTTTYTVDEAITHVGFGKFQWLVLLYAGLGLVAEVMEIMLLSFIGPAIKSQWSLSSTQESSLTSAVFAGLILGSYFWGFVSDNYGRRKGFLGIALVTSVTGLLSAFSPNHTTLVILRALVGIGLGSGHVFLSWFFEFVPTPSRGMWSAVISIAWTVGSVFVAALALIVMPTLNWRWLLALSSVPSFIVLLLYGLPPESPMYLFAKGRSEDTYHVLKRLAVVNRRDLPSGVLVSSMSARKEEEFYTTDDTPLLSPSRKKTEIVKSGFSSFSILFSSRLIRTTILLWILYFAISFAYYGIILLTSGLSSVKMGCGSSVLLLGDSVDKNLYINVLVTSMAEFPGLLFSAVVIDRLGRKVSMTIMSILTFIFLLPLVIHQPAILTTVSLFGARMFANGIFVVLSIYAPEVYPTSIRSTGAGIGSVMGRVGGMVSPLIAVGLIDNCHQTAAVVVLEGVVVLSLICSLLFPFETKGRELTDSIIDLSPN